MPLEEFKGGIELLFDNVYFNYNGETYQQTFGLPMGSSISPVAANLVLEHIEEIVIMKLAAKGIRVLEYKRYVDDTWMLIHKRFVQRVLNEFNAFHPRIQFTSQIGDPSMPFLDLDIAIKESDRMLTFRWYRKPTWSGRYLQYDAQTPSTYKRNTVGLLTRKVFELSDDCYHDEDHKIVEDTLRQNGYPSSFIARNVEKTLRRLNEQTARNELTSNLRISLPYFPSIFEKLKFLLRKYEIDVVGKNAEALNSLFTRLKDPVPKELKSCVCYQLICDCGKTYIGQTMQYFSTRFKQHESSSSSSAMSAHLNNDACNINFDNAKILCNEANWFKRIVKEAAFIKSRENINNQHDNFNIGHQYDMIL